MTRGSAQLKTTDAGERMVVLSGDWTLAALRTSIGSTSKALKSVSTDPTLKWDLRQIDSLDSTGALLIWRTWGGDRRRSALLKPEHSAILDRIAAVPPVEPARWRPDLLAPIVFLGASLIIPAFDIHADFSQIQGDVLAQAQFVG